MAARAPDNRVSPVTLEAHRRVESRACHSRNATGTYRRLPVITRELLAAEASIGRPSRGLQGRRLSDEEFAGYQPLSSRYIREDLEGVVQSGDWRDATPEERKEMVDGIKRVAREDARADLALDRGEEDGGDIPPTPPGYTVTPPPAGFEIIR